MHHSIHDPSLIVALARALAKPGSRLLVLDENNGAIHRDDGTLKRYDLDEIPGLLRDGIPFVLGALAPDVLAYDLDVPEHLEALNELVPCLSATGVPFLRLNSGRPGHVHLFVVVPDPAIRGALVAAAKSVGLPPARTSIRPPASPHRLGLPVSIIDDPHEWLQAIQEARRAPLRGAKAKWRQIVRDTYPRPLSASTDASRLVFGLALGMCRSGLGPGAAYLILSAYRGGAVFRDRPYPKAWFESYVWPMAVAEIEASPSPRTSADTANAIERFRAAVEAADFPGRTGRTDRAVLLRAFVPVMQRQQTMTPSLGHREIRERALKCKETVGDALARLEKAGWIRRLTRGSGSTRLVIEGRGPVRLDAGEEQSHLKASVWGLGIPSGAGVTNQDSSSDTPPHQVVTVLDRYTTLEDLARDGVLGADLPDILDLLCTGPKTAVEITEDLKLSTVRYVRTKKLTRLIDYGIIRIVDDDKYGLVEDLEEALQAAAERLGVAGKTEAIRERHDAERAAYGAALLRRCRQRVAPRHEAAPEPAQNAVEAAQEVPSPVDSETPEASLPAAPTARPITGADLRELFEDDAHPGKAIPLSRALKRFRARRPVPSTTRAAVPLAEHGLQSVGT